MVSQPLEPLRVVVYVAGPTTQRLRAELGSVLKYAREELGLDRVLDGTAFDLAAEELQKRTEFDDNLIHIHEETPEGPGQQIGIFFDRLDRERLENTVQMEPEGARPGLVKALDRISDSETKDRHVVVARADRLLDDDGGLDWIRKMVGEFETSIHLSEDRVTIRSGAAIDGAVMRALTLLASHTTDPASGEVRATLKHTGGRPPLGFTSEEGELVPDEDYGLICSVLQDVRLGSKSKRQAAAEIGCTRQTVGAALDRPQLYALGQD
jgi:DNA invertase Pin-like site-specific DNA recombinase